MRQGLGHSSDRAFVHRRVRVTIDLAADTAHDSLVFQGVLKSLREVPEARPRSSAYSDKSLV
jgi:hypothetical protein